ncbi:PREDICTED: putative FBD-associated F-box protein At5g22720 [Populus euphratica]|uniref:FBD-associated F-box protein At5g22720 n=1 Tax=Populus euphratica TaxID=75702 RepID=A0AAJ6TXF4_POPEU|nr:PREDICTED: putative FBD-associated F-box protein At5g22720 [Populus euphratica]
MEKQREKTRKKLTSEGVDRLRDLPDDLLHYILYFLDTKYAVLTSALSKRWRFFWTSVPDLNFDRESFDKFTSFKNFVLTVLQRRQRDSKIRSKRFYLSESFGVTALTTLHLEHCYFSDGSERTGCFDISAICPNLINFCLIHCVFGMFEVLKISGPQLVNLTLEYVCGNKLEISAPKLTFFKFIPYYSHLSVAHLPSLEHADVDIYRPYAYPRKIEILFNDPDVFEHQPSPFSRLKSLKLKVDHEDEPLIMPAKVMPAHFFSGSPCCTTVCTVFLRYVEANS